MISVAYALYFIRLVLFGIGVLAIVVNTLRYIKSVRVSVTIGCASPKTMLSRIPESVKHCLLYNESRVLLALSVFFHVSLIATILSHLNLYFQALAHPVIQPVILGAQERSLETILSATTGLLGILLLVNRLLRFAKGRSWITPSIILLHIIVQAIMWSWTIFYVTGSIKVLNIALLATEIFHAYMLTWTGFHGIMFLLRIYYSSKILRQPPIITIAPPKEICRKQLTPP